MTKRIDDQAPEERRHGAEARHLTAESEGGNASSGRGFLEARGALLRYVHEKYGEGLYEYNLEAMAQPDLSEDEIEELEQLRAAQRRG